MVPPNFWEWFIEAMKKQGIVAMLLVFAIIYFYFDNKAMKTDIKDQNIYIRDKLSDVLGANTDALKSFRDELNNNTQTVRNYFYTAPYRNPPAGLQQPN